MSRLAVGLGHFPVHRQQGWSSEAESAFEQCVVLHCSLTGWSWESGIQMKSTCAQVSANSLGPWGWVLQTPS